MKIETNNTKIDVLEERVCTMRKQNDIDHATILSKIEEINTKLDHTYVTNDRFKPVEKMAYGLVTVIVLAVLGAIIRLVLV